jgi:hypothetical protein
MAEHPALHGETSAVRTLILVRWFEGVTPAKLSDNGGWRGYEERTNVLE